MIEPGRQAASRGRQLGGLMLFAASAALLIGLLNDVTRERIEANQARHALALVAATLPNVRYDNEPTQDVIMLADPELPGSASGLPAYRARLNGVPVAAVLTVTAKDGYVGPITLLVGIDPQGTVLRVRVSEQRETPGLGDRIEAANSDWINQFDGLSPQPGKQWRLQRDGGELDQISGATITSRSVTNAVRATITYFRQHTDQILTAPADR